MAFRKKWHYAAAFDPDVMVICEAEEPSRLPDDLMAAFPNHDWVGDLSSKGLLVMSKAGWNLARAPEYDPVHKLALPVIVAGPIALALLAVWAQRTSTATYCQHTDGAIRASADRLRGGAIVAGDFNANAVWDQMHHKKVTHSQNVQLLRSLGLESAYHGVSGEMQGEETLFTHAYRRWPTHLFHIDYCFYSPKQLALTSATVPPVAEWSQHSDHGPLVVDLEVRQQGTVDGEVRP